MILNPNVHSLMDMPRRQEYSPQVKESHLLSGFSRRPLRSPGEREVDARNIEVGQALGPNYTWMEALGGMISETIYLSLSTALINRSIGPQ